MIRGFVTIALGGTLLAMAVPAQAEKAPPRPSEGLRYTTAPAVEAVRAAPDATSTHADGVAAETRGTAEARATRRGPALPHPFREQVLPEARV